MTLNTLGNKYFWIIIAVVLIGFVVVIFFAFNPVDNSKLYDISNLSLQNMTNKTAIWATK
jgi:hypothetical protein